MDRRTSLRRVQVHRPGRTDLHRPRKTTLQGRLRRRQTYLRSLRQSSSLHHLHNPRRHNPRTRNPRRRPHQHGKERIRRNSRRRERSQRGIPPVRHGRNEHRHRRHRKENQETIRGGQETNLARQREQPPPPSPSRKSCDVRRDARVRKRIRISDRQEQPSPRNSPPRGRIPSPRRKERIHTITPSSRGHYQVWRRQDHREEA